MANRFSLEATITPRVDDRAADREGERLADTFEDSLGNLGIDVDAGGVDNLGGSRGGLNTSAGSIGSTLVGLATQRNDLLAHIAESVDESFVESAGGAGGEGGGGMVGSILKVAGGTRLAGSGSVGGSLLSRLFGGVGAASAGLATGIGIGTYGILRYRQQMMQQGRVRETAPPGAGTAAGDTGGIGGTGVGETDVPAPTWLSDLTEWSLPQTPAGWMEDFLSWELPGATPWMTDFLEWSVPAASSWITDFTGWEFDSPAWIDQFLDWEFTPPDAPAWADQLLGVFGMGGRGQVTQTAAQRGGGFQSDQGLFNAAERQNRAADRNRTDVRINPQIDLDPSQVARELVPEVERFVDEALSDLEDSLRDGAGNANLGAGPGRRFG